MTLRTTRRRFISTALSAGVGSTVFQPYEAADATGLRHFSPEDASGSDPNFVMGKVVAVSDDGALRIFNEDGAVQAVRRHSGTASWKASYVNRTDVAVGDCVFTRGEHDDNDQLILNTVWANIGKFEGDLTSLDVKRKTLRLAKKGRLGRPEGELSLRLKDDTIVRGDDGRESQGDLGKLKPKSSVVIVSYGDPETRELTVHRIEAVEVFGSGVISPEPPEPAKRDSRSRPIARAATHFPIARRGNASFFCCGNVSGCGYSCGSSTSGACGNCRSSLNHMAWPKISGCGPFCSGCCLETDYPRYGCGTRFYCENACSGYTTILTITDCGPTVRCRSTGCQSYDSVRFDLTPCAFSAIHGNFSIGHANVWLSAPI